MTRSFVRSATLIVLGASLFAGAARVGDAQERSDARLKQLLREKHTLRKQAAEMIRKMHETGGGVSTVEVIEASLAALRAELDTIQTRDERLGVLQRIVDEERKREQFLLTGTRGLSALEQFDVRVRRIDAEIALERAKLG